MAMYIIDYCMFIIVYGNVYCCLLYFIIVYGNVYY